MAGAIEALDRIEDSDAVAVAIDTADLWFAHRRRRPPHPRRRVIEISAWALSGGFGMEMPAIEVRFDTADARWLSAYAHLLSGVSEGILATDPTRPSPASPTPARPSRTLAPRRQRLHARQPVRRRGRPARHVRHGRGGPARPRPHPRRARPPPRHRRGQPRLLDARPQETDNDREWIPNKTSTARPACPFPPETGPCGSPSCRMPRRCCGASSSSPFWRLGDGAGSTSAAFLQDPPQDVDVAGLIQGATLLPYLREGPLATGRTCGASPPRAG
jgi:hypothetical protein